MGAVALIVAGMLPSVQYELADPRAPAGYDALAREDPDYRYILQYAAEVQRFRDSFKWWRERWINFTVHWRPLSSQVFWLEYKLIGPGNLEKWIWVNIVGHLAVLGLLVAFVGRAIGSIWCGLLAALVFSGWRPVPPAILPLWSPGVPASCALAMPKDQPEMFLTTFVLLGMLLVSRSRWLGALLAVAAAVCFKESGWMGFPLLLVALVMTDGFSAVRRIPWWAWITAVVIVFALLALRWVAFPGYFMGVKTTANVAWFKRGLHVAQGPWLMALLPPYTGAGLFATSLLALILLRDRIRSIWMLALVMATLLVAVGINALMFHTPFLLGIFHLLDHTQLLPITLAAFAWAVFAWALLTDGELRLRGISAVVAVLIGTIPWMSVTQAGFHTLYMQYAFQAMLVTLAWVAVGRRLRTAWLSWSRSRGTVAETVASIPAQEVDYEIPPDR